MAEWKPRYLPSSNKMVCLGIAYFYYPGMLDNESVVLFNNLVWVIMVSLSFIPTEGWFLMRPKSIHYGYKNKNDKIVYLCSEKIKVAEDNITTDWKKVTCKNCLNFRRIMEK